VLAPGSHQAGKAKPTRRPAGHRVGFGRRGNAPTDKPQPENKVQPFERRAAGSKAAL